MSLPRGGCGLTCGWMSKRRGSRRGRLSTRTSTCRPSGAERSREIEFDVIKNALHLREFSALTEILPWLRDHEAANWLLEQLPEGDEAELVAEASGAPMLAAQAQV